MQGACRGRGEQRTSEMGPEGWEGVWKRELIRHSRWNSVSEGAEAGCIRCTENDLPGRVGTYVGGKQHPEKLD